jgi:hypothetical protein
VTDEAGGRVMRQVAPFPDVLADLVAVLKYKPRWGFYLYDQYDRDQGSVGLTLIIRVVTTNSHPPHDDIVVNHLMPVPPAAFDMRSWRRWLFDQCVLVDLHEACEFFEVDGDKPYAPSHGPGNSPYLVREVGTDLDRRTSFRGEVNP